MTRHTKRAAVDAAFLSLTPEERRDMERAASIMKISVSRLLQAGHPVDRVQEHVPLAHTTSTMDVSQRVVDLHDDDTPDDGQQTDNDSRDSASEADIAPWQSSGAEFRNIDDDVAREYETVAPWGEDFPVLSQATAPPAQGPAPGSKTGPARARSAVRGPDTLWDFPTLGVSYVTHEAHQSPSTVATLTALSTSVPTPGYSSSGSFITPHEQEQSWEVIEMAQPPQPSQQASAVPPRVYDWATNVGFSLPAQPSVNSGLADMSSDALRFIPVDPVQPQAPSRPQKRGPFQDRERKEETSRTRGLKACVRCRMQKIRCTIVEDNPSGICGTCLTVSKQKVHYLPCLRHRLTECILYRTGKAPGLEFTFRWPVMKLKDISEWESPNLRTVLIKSDVCEVPLKLVVRRFIPIPHKDSIHRSWVDHRTGVKKFKLTTPYAVVNMKNAVQEMREYVTANVFKCMDYFLRGSDQLVKETYAFARLHMQRVESDEERALLGLFFRLWFAVRRTATTEHIVGDDLLDMEPETKDESYPLFGKVPLPPVMIQQLDMILTLGVLDPLRKQVLEEFQKLALANNPRNWMTIYLVTFMSLHSCAKITAEQYQNGRKHGLLRRYAIPNFISDRHHSANVFLSHFHYRTESCNPFKQDWKMRHMTPFSYMSVDDIQFLERTKVLLKEREDVIKTNSKLDLYEHELYFVAQMFQENWQPQDTIIDYTEGTVNNVGMKMYAGDDRRGKM